MNQPENRRANQMIAGLGATDNTACGRRKRAAPFGERVDQMRGFSGREAAAQRLHARIDWHIGME
ncbi:MULTISPECIES: hypothetical protein [Burkholderia]|uniref:hypothetical protein n=1 Tax=Burkholderia TaxID=32008 RepID=UPI00076C8CE1|nr:MULTISPECIES: hypothetical protein [Burkholderia]KVE40469.1 hypothetical protein WS69_06245 [Burkholderia sp. BDU5]